MDGVVLPGVGGLINASNSDSGPDLKSQNKKKRKWGTGANAEGFMTIGPVDHNEAHELRLASHKERRDRASNLINRDRNEYSDGGNAMSEIFGRKKQRSELFKSYKEREYSFADDSDYLAMGAYSAGTFKEGCSCHSCASCRDKKRADAEYREYTTKMRKKLASGDVKGDFAGPDRSFPISSPEDVGAAWASAGRGKQDPRKTYANIIRIAKKNGWESGLPQTVRDRLAAGESGLPG